MQNNLKSLQDKIKNLESKLTMANDQDDSSLLESEFISVNSNRGGRAADKATSAVGAG